LTHFHVVNIADYFWYTSTKTTIWNQYTTAFSDTFWTVLLSCPYQCL